MALARTTGGLAAPWRARFLLLTLAFALPFSQAFYSYMREPLRFEMRQSLVAALSTLQRAAVMAMLIVAAMAAPGRLSVLCGAALVAYALFALIWKAASKSVVSSAVAPMTLKVFWTKLGAVLAGTVLWIHLNGVLFQASQTFDLLALGWFIPDLSGIARYGIALKTANFFQIVPIALSSSLGIWLGKRMFAGESSRERRIVITSTAAMTLSCVALYAVGWFAAQPLLGLIGRGKITALTMDASVTQFRWLLAGVLILASTHPLSTYLMARQAASAFPGALLPWALGALAIYSVGLWARPTFSPPRSSASPFTAFSPYLRFPFSSG